MTDESCVACEAVGGICQACWDAHVANVCRVGGDA